MTIKAEKKEHQEHRIALKPLLKHLKEDEIKLSKKDIHLTHAKKVKDGKHSHKHKNKK